MVSSTLNDICGICGNRKHEPVSDMSGVDDTYLNLIASRNCDSRYWRKCCGCQIYSSYPSLTDSALKDLYRHFRDCSFRNETPDEYFDRISGLARGESENEAKVEWLRKHLPSIFLLERARVLDIGCGGGVFLHTFGKYLENLE